MNTFFMAAKGTHLAAFPQPSGLLPRGRGPLGSFLNACFNQAFILPFPDPCRILFVFFLAGRVELKFLITFARTISGCSSAR